jgi:hypothetical protein
MTKEKIRPKFPKQRLNALYTNLTSAASNTDREAGVLSWKKRYWEKNKKDRKKERMRKNKGIILRVKNLAKIGRRIKSKFWISLGAKFFFFKLRGMSRKWSSDRYTDP